jgi:HrpA-like RNA helicase
MDKVMLRNGADAWIKVMTDGLLVSMLQSKDLGNAQIIMLDEIHERGTNMDMCMGFLKPVSILYNERLVFTDVTKILRERPELQVVLMSATGENQVFLDFFADFDPQFLEFPGRPQHIDEYFIDEADETDWAQCTASLVRELLVDPTDVWYPGDVLVFCPGQREIRQSLLFLDTIRSRYPVQLENVEFCTLYRDMPASDQQEVLQVKYKRISVDGVDKKTRVRKVILSTNISETSITLPELDIVIDSGYSKVSNYLAKFDARELSTCRCSWAQCWQRRGRVGRKRRGAWTIMMSPETFHEMEVTYKFPLPPILRTDIASTMMRICASDGGWSKFEWIREC